MGVIGIFVLLAIAFALSVDRRRAVNWRILGWGLGLQFAMALFALRTRAGIRLFSLANDLADAFVQFADAGIRFVFGDWPASRRTRTGSRRRRIRRTRRPDRWPARTGGSPAACAGRTAPSQTADRTPSR